MTKLPPWLDAGEAIARRAWEMPASDRASALEMRDKRIWRVPLDPLLAALKAHAEGREYSAPPDEWLTTDEIRAEADRWMRETGKTAVELSAIMERVARLDARTVNLGDPEIALAVGMAADDLQAAAHEGRVVARGRAASRPDDPRDAIPAKWFDEQREIDPFGTLRGPGGKVEWTDVQFRTEDVLREWPEGGEPATDAAAAPEPASASLPPSPRRAPASVDYRATDAPLISEMRELVQSKRARNPWDAALQVCGRAKGYGKPESKAKRLLKRYNELSRVQS